MMLPLTNKEIKSVNPKDTFRCSTPIYYAALSISFYGVISTLLLPFTIRGRIGGQYGVLNMVGDNSYITLLPLTDMPVALEVFLISLLFLANLLGFISVFKRSIPGLVLYSLVHAFEFFISYWWIICVFHEHIKSHVMSQYSLRIYCSFAFVIETISVVVICSLTANVIKCKDE